MFQIKAFPALALLLGSSTFASATDQDHDHGGRHGGEPARATPGDPYLLATDPVSGKELGPLEDQIILRHEGRELRFGSQETVRAFKADPAKYLDRVDAQLVRQQLPFYPLETCPVSGEELGEMGEPIDLIYRNRLVRLCCKGCKPKFRADPAPYLAKLDRAVIAAQGPGYPLEVCPVSGEALEGEMGGPIDFVVGNRLVRLCCKGCKKTLLENPLEFLAKLDHGQHGAGSHEEHGSHGEHDHGGRD